MRYGVIMAGGSGTRLWPLSRQDTPKQLLQVHGRSLLQHAYDRLVGPVEPHAIFVCVLEQHRDQVLAALPDLPPENLLGEPMGRDTANAVGFAAAVITAHDPDAVIATVTADHVIEPVERFQSSLVGAFELAEHEPVLVTFGVVPTAPLTGLGYVERGAPIPGSVGSRVVSFREKPDLRTAESYLRSGGFLWNSGMFVWRGAQMLAELAAHLPSSAAGFARVARAWASPEASQTLAAVYPELTKISVDFAVLEPAAAAGAVAVVPLDVDWLDVGSWPTYAATLDQDDDGNAVGGRTVLVDSSGNVVVATDPDHLVATIGLRDTVVVAMPDVTLVCPRSDAERVRELVAEVSRRYPGRT